MGVSVTVILGYLQFANWPMRRKYTPIYPRLQANYCELHRAKKRPEPVYLLEILAFIGLLWGGVYRTNRRKPHEQELSDFMIFGIPSSIPSRGACYLLLFFSAAHDVLSLIFV
jgi:hypothetical protein